MPLGLGLRNAARTQLAAYWASWADTLPMIQTRHPAVADLVLRHLEGESASPSLRAGSRAATQLEGVQGFEVPQWRDVAAGWRPPDRAEEGGNMELRPDWSRISVRSLFPQMGPSERAMVTEWSWRGVAFSTSPSSLLTQIE